jgi:pimeloyl-ACP methyl ester carboxylesterase
MKWLLLAIALLGAGAAAADPVDRAARLPDGRSINLWCEGKGPTVVMDGGWAADSRAWRKIIPLLVPGFRACAQDRAGSGRSSPGPLPRDGEAVARDLAAALKAAGEKGPYLLVGHSLGGLNMRHFARLFPAETAGMVLVDPSVPNQVRRFEAIGGPGAGSISPLITRARQCLDAARAGPVPQDEALKRCRTDPPEAAAERWEARLSELEAMAGTTSSGLDTQGPGSVAAPLIVLTAGRSYADPRALAFWESLHAETAAISVKGSSRLVPGSGHMMIFDAPEAIADAVRDVAAIGGKR